MAQSVSQIVVRERVARFTVQDCGQDAAHGKAVIVKASVCLARRRCSGSLDSPTDLYRDFGKCLDILTELLHAKDGGLRLFLKRV